jgi:malate dehydrogenase
MGGHGDTMVPLLDYTSIGGIPIQNFIDQGIVKKKTIELIIERTRNGGGEVVSLMKNSSAFFSPACSAIEMLESYLFDQKKLLPCSTYLDGEYGVKNVFVGVPVIIGKGGIEKIIELKLSKESKTEFSKSVNSVKDLIKKCKKLLE